MCSGKLSFNENNALERFLEKEVYRPVFQYFSGMTTMLFYDIL